MNMKNGLWYPVLSAIISGIVISIFSFYFLSEKNSDNLKNIRVAISSFELSTEVFDGLISDTLEEDILLSVDARLQIGKALERIGNATVVSYEIENAGNRTIEDFRVFFGQHDMVFLTKDGETKQIELKEKEISIKLLPRSNANLLVFGSMSYILPSEKFTIGGTEIPILDSKEDILSELLGYIPFLPKSAPIIAGIIIASMLVVLLVLIFSIVFAVNKNRPSELVKIADDDSIANSLALVNYLKSDDEGRYKSIVEKAEKVFTNWKKAESEKR